MYCKYFSPVCALHFFFISIDICSLPIFSMWCKLSVSYLRSLFSTLRSQRYSLITFEKLDCVLSFTFSYIIYVIDFCVWHEIRIQFHFCPYRYPYSYPIVPVPFFGKTILPPLFCNAIFAVNHVCLCMDLFLGFLLYSFELLVLFLCQHLTILITIPLQCIRYLILKSSHPFFSSLSMSWLSLALYIFIFP